MMEFLEERGISVESVGGPQQPSRKWFRWRVGAGRATVPTNERWLFAVACGRSTQWVPLMIG
jgi:hypothetical protein